MRRARTTHRARSRDVSAGSRAGRSERPRNDPGAPDRRVDIWIWYPLALYFWKGRRERFIGFHAVQSLLLVAAVIPVVCGDLLLTFVVIMWLEPRFQSMEPYMGSVSFGVYSLVTLFPVFMIIGMGIYVMRGGRGQLPLLGRLAKRIIGTTAPAR